MITDKIICPKCKTEIPITEALQGQIENRIRKEFNEKWEIRENSANERDKLASKREKELVIERESFEAIVSNQVKESLESERKKLVLKIRGEEQTKVDLEVAELKSADEEQKKALSEYKNKVLDAKKKEMKANQEKEDLEIKYQDKLIKEKCEIEQEVTKKVDEKYRLQLSEKDKKLSDISFQLEETNKKLHQGSQQLQGEVLELELEQILKTTFPHDSITPVPKGVEGADVLQKVISPRGETCGTIIWESKRTKAWSNTWIKKLKDDQLEQNADIAVLYSITLPKDVTKFTVLDDVWITSHSSLVPIAAALRSGLIDISRLKKTAVGKNQKMELLFNYLTGKEFVQRVGVIFQTHIDMKNQLEQEKRAIKKIWSKREIQIERVQSNLSSMYGDLEEIAGASLPQLEALELKALPDSLLISDSSPAVDDNELPD